MPKRVRADPEPVSAPEAPSSHPSEPTDELVDSVAGLAGWCDKELREAAHVHIDNVESLECENSAMDSFGDDSFDDFLESLEQDQRITVEEHQKGTVAEAWRRGVADATRLHALTSLWTDSAFYKRFHAPTLSRKTLRTISEASTDAVDEWYFELGYELAKCIMAAGGKQADSEDDSDDEPVEEEESEEESEEDGEESQSDAGSTTGSDA